MLKPIGTETGDDAVVARTDGRTIHIDYADQAGTAPAAPAVVDRCQAITGSGTQCKRKPKDGSRFCWQHGAE